MRIAAPEPYTAWKLPVGLVEASEQAATRLAEPAPQVNAPVYAAPYGAYPQAPWTAPQSTPQPWSGGYAAGYPRLYPGAYAGTSPVGYPGNYPQAAHPWAQWAAQALGGLWNAASALAHGVQALLTGVLRSLTGGFSRGPGAYAPNNLSSLKPADLARLGRTDRRAFLAALWPAAIAVQQADGVPAAVTLAQAALETGWGQRLAAGYNLFGIKGTGPAGSRRERTWEVVNGRNVTTSAGFAAYHNFQEAVEAHGQLFHNGLYHRAVANYARSGSAEGFARDITGIYATDPAYGTKLIAIMRSYQLS